MNSHGIRIADWSGENDADLTRIAMYTYIMSHRTQITLSDAQYARLKRESQRTGAGLAQLVRQALTEVYGGIDRTDVDEALAISFGAWQDREFDGEEYVELLRPGMAQRLDR